MDYRSRIATLQSSIVEWVQAKARLYTGFGFESPQHILAVGNQLVWYYLCRGPLFGVNQKLDPDSNIRAKRVGSILAILILIAAVVLAPDERLRLGLLLILFNPLWLYSIPNLFDPLMENRAYTMTVPVALIIAYVATVTLWAPAVLLLLWGVRTYQRAGYWNTRYGFWKQAYKESPDASRPRINWAVALSKNDQMDESMDIYRQFISSGSVEHDAALAVANLSLIYMYLNKITNDNSWRLLATELLVYGEFTWPGHPRIRFNRGCLFMGYKRFLEAIDEFDIAIRVLPEYPSAYRQRARCYGLLGDLKSAQEDAARADACDGMQGVVRLMRRDNETSEEYDERLARVQMESTDVRGVPEGTANDI